MDKLWEQANKAVIGAQEAAPEAVAEALAFTLESIPPGSLDFAEVAAEIQRIARAGVPDEDLCTAIPAPPGDEAGRLLALVARMLLATMGGDLAGAAVNEISALLAEHFVRALARRAGLERSLPFKLGPEFSALDAMHGMARVLSEPAVRATVPDLLARHLADAGEGTA
ncbi:hypothetical protein [Thermomonospora amylolytica]|uniref:hypothetical protein n=1 Tax=Thermomonospora amylolytica TaxID=1411117 RepID=UPI000E6C1C26|nr:hypothetical protein [Thermomonospora amylolytica]